MTPARHHKPVQVQRRNAQPIHPKRGSSTRKRKLDKDKAKATQAQGDAEEAEVPDMDALEGTSDATLAALAQANASEEGTDLDDEEAIILPKKKRNRPSKSTRLL
jgi:hypothetical protein